MSEIVAIIPAYNEEAGIGSIILRTQQYVDRIIVVDDGSVDKTVDVVKLTNVELIQHHKNKGKGEALKSAFALLNDDDIVVTIDADGQHNPDEIPNLLKPILDQEADIVNGSRYLTGTDENTPHYRRVGQKVLDKATNFASGIDLTDSQSGFRAFSSRSIGAFNFNESGFAVESEMIADASQACLKIIEVPIKVRYDVGTSTKNPVVHGVKVLSDIVRDIELKRPLYFFTLPGIIITFIGLAMSLMFARDYLTGRSINFEPTAMAVLLAFVGGFLVLTGIILDTIRRLLKNNNI